MKDSDQFAYSVGDPQLHSTKVEHLRSIFSRLGDLPEEVGVNTRIAMLTGPMDPVADLLPRTRVMGLPYSVKTERSQVHSTSWLGRIPSFGEPAAML